ncbi:hypothetical protein M426DRAFT_113511 [Hypoxylon sp. CI-4A]|nr:hypothetical protein M426DRAFT_113511 [Hypoxylon sp. CI-4A]
MTYSDPNSTPIASRAQIAIVGMGPRGTSVLERICASASALLAQNTHLTIHVIDPSTPGPGRVWRTDQSSHLLMNTVASQITLFTDDSVMCSGQIRSGPSLYDWAARDDINLDLGPDQYPTRAQYGQYLEWFFNETLRKAPGNVKVEIHSARGIRLDDESSRLQTLALSNGRTLASLSAVVLAQGHLPLSPDPKQQQSATYAEEHSLHYFPPANPADVDLSTIRPREPTLLRGLGLTFVDYMTVLTAGRGGYYTPEAEGLRYHRSGKEPRVYASSRRGIPYQARGENQKGAHGRRYPVLLTDKLIAHFRQRADDDGDAPDFMREIWPIVSKEVALVYYECLVGQESLEFRNRFITTQHNGPDEAALLAEYGILEHKRWSWDRVLRPQGERSFGNAEEWREWLLEHLRVDAQEAALGNVKGPLKAALDMMRDLRNELRQIVDHGGLTGDSHRDHLDGWYTPLNGYLSIGPPQQRIEQMIALMEAGVLSVVGPCMSVKEEDGAWIAESPEVPGSTVRVTTLIEARLPEPDLRHTGDELLAYLFETGQCRPHSVDWYETGGLDVTDSPYHLIDRKGHAHDRRFAVGVPTEGVRWVTAAGARPGVNSVTLCDTDAVARAALQVAVKAETSISEGVNGAEFVEWGLDNDQSWPKIDSVAPMSKLIWGTKLVGH